MGALPSGPAHPAPVPAAQRGANPIDTLIRNARIHGGQGVVDLRITGDRIAGIGAGLAGAPGEVVVDAEGAALLPGLRDHHIHLVSLAASLDSLRCGPPDVHNARALAALLRHHNTRGGDWLRGIAYHPCVAGDIDRDWLDRHIPDRPLRLQHRGGRLWVLNSRALQEVGAMAIDVPAGLERVDGRPTGRLYEGDEWLRTRIGSRRPDLARASARLAACGITGLTDTTPANGVDDWNYFRQSQDEGQLRQRVRMMGSRDLELCPQTPLLQRGEYKIHLLESRLPDPDVLERDIAAVHSAGRAIAIHCVTLTELVFALGALQSAGVRRGDRIEHASVCPPELLDAIRQTGLRVVTQPHFIAERGDQYRAEVEASEQPWLYRCASILDAGIPLAGGSDAPFGDPDPWRAMRAAVERRTPSGVVMGAGERLTPEQALGLFLCEADLPGVAKIELAVGARADLCLLDRPWQAAREDLDSACVRLTWRAGQLIHGAS